MFSTGIEELHAVCSGEDFYTLVTGDRGEEVHMVWLWCVLCLNFMILLCDLLKNPFSAILSGVFCLSRSKSLTSDFSVPKCSQRSSIGQIICGGDYVVWMYPKMCVCCVCCVLSCCVMLSCVFIVLLCILLLPLSCWCRLLRYLWHLALINIIV